MAAITAMEQGYYWQYVTDCGLEVLAEVQLVLFSINCMVTLTDFSVFKSVNNRFRNRVLKTIILLG